ncbi:hypothetical protein K788_0001016 [Paraburkholderia caribensis MBA4]|uniref:Uncharacterized protein n=1 Tax=Paraburkholderia caribensis MBA4 TaxID=1323664 RepID=A0A0P0RH55_9BURK|nr:hypothetical protein K788_0001016 [Paraburkholderia caribensis MBA4]
MKVRNDTQQMLSRKEFLKERRVAVDMDCWMKRFIEHTTAGKVNRGNPYRH